MGCWCCGIFCKNFIDNFFKFTAARPPVLEVCNQSWFPEDNSVKCGWVVKIITNTILPSCTIKNPSQWMCDKFFGFVVFSSSLAKSVERSKEVPVMFQWAQIFLRSGPEMCPTKHIHRIELEMKWHSGLLNPIKAQEAGKLVTTFIFRESIIRYIRITGRIELSIPVLKISEWYRLSGTVWGNDLALAGSSLSLINGVVWPLEISSLEGLNCSFF